MISYEAGRIRAPELFGDFWFNSEPISVRAMRGSVLLIDFWDYGSVACMRTQPYLKEWQRLYRDFELLVLGVHTPEFKFGRNPEHVQKAIQRAALDFPVVMDNDGLIWASYGCRLWPTKYLVDKDGFLRFSHTGEGSYEQFERAIQMLLVDTGYHGLLPELMEPLRATDYAGAICFRPTPEIRLGYLRGTIGNPEGHGPESTIEYADQGLHLLGRVYLKGKWYNEREFMRFDGSRDEKGHVSLGYEAVEVNSILDTVGKSPCKVLAYQDGKPLGKENAGLDVSFNSKGESLIVVNGPRTFNIVSNREFGQHELELVATNPGFALYTFSFVTGVIPELILSN